MSTTMPMPKDEMGRVIKLSEFDLDYSNLDENFKDLTRLAAKVAGTDISLVNLLDSYTQWTVSSVGIDLDSMEREHSVCTHTIAQDTPFEVLDLSSDERFLDRDFVTGAPHLKYYFGVPLRTSDGHNLGALCVLDTQAHQLTPEKIELLKMIADEVVNRLNALKTIESLKQQMTTMTFNQKKVVHDIRGPIGGIVGLAQIIAEQGDKNKMGQVLEFINLIQKSGNSILDLANEILADQGNEGSPTSPNDFNLIIFKDKLEKLYTPQAINKKIQFAVQTSMSTQNVGIPKNKLLQITGNLISNSMKFTPEGGKINVNLNLTSNQNPGTYVLLLVVSDTGVGMSESEIDKILIGVKGTSDGTSGEKGYGFGLALVKHLVDDLKGSMSIHSEEGKGTKFKIVMPIG